MNLRRVTAAGGGYPFAVAAVALATALFLPFREVLQTTVFMLLFVPVIITVARLVGVRASATAAVLAFISLDFLFIPPYYHLTVASLSEWLGLLVFLIVAIAAGQQTGQLRARERAAVRRQEELSLLNRLAFRIASEKSVTAIAEFIVGQVTTVLGARRAALYIGGPGAGTPQSLAQAGLTRPSSGEAALVSWVLRSGKAVGLPSTEGVPYDQRIVSVGVSDAIPGVEADGVFLPLQTATSLEGVLFAEPSAPGGFSADDARLLAAVANLSATSLERQRLEQDAAHAEALREADRLKSTLVSSVSHELKTPLAAATARVTGLVEEGESCDAARVHEELGEVAEDLKRLNDSIGDLLDLSRLESDAWQPHFDLYDVRDILGTVLSRLSAGQRDRVQFELADKLPDIRADFAQLARALSNLVENALVYSPVDSTVIVSARPLRGGGIELWVTDSGPGVPDEEKLRVFEKFYRGAASASAPSGTGLGLAITREIVRTHDGTLRVEDAVPHGARFVLTIPPTAEEHA
jgi:two-component system, OmpR family, sensor histidine kinase KdpD